jgi:hypothetical protein
MVLTASTRVSMRLRPKALLKTMLDELTQQIGKSVGCCGE